MQVASAVALISLSVGGIAMMNLYQSPVDAVPATAANALFIPTGTAVNVSTDGAQASRFLAGTQVARSIGAWF